MFDCFYCFITNFPNVITQNLHQKSTLYLELYIGQSVGELVGVFVCFPVCIVIFHSKKILRFFTVVSCSR